MDPFHSHLRQTFDHIIAQMRWDEIESTIEAMAEEMTGEPFDSLCARLLPPAAETQPVHVWFPSMAHQADVSRPGIPVGTCQPTGLLETKKGNPKSKTKTKLVKKKPANAFHYFARERRKNVEMAYKITTGSFVNKILGEKWHALTTAQQMPYYMLVHSEEESNPELSRN